MNTSQTADRKANLAEHSPHCLSLEKRGVTLHAKCYTVKIFFKQSKGLIFLCFPGRTKIFEREQRKIAIMVHGMIESLTDNNLVLYPTITSNVEKKYS